MNKIDKRNERNQRNKINKRNERNERNERKQIRRIRRIKRRIIRWIITLSLLCIGIGLPVTIYQFIQAKNNVDTINTSIIQEKGEEFLEKLKISNSIKEPQNKNILNASDIYSKHGILMNLHTGEVLFTKAENKRTYEASLTKIMTVLVAIENYPDLNHIVTLTQEDFEGLYEKGASMAGLMPGEEVPFIDLLYGIMLPSGADACTSIANQVASSQQNFVKLMNQKAKDLKMMNTHFTNVSGLHEKNHYTTVSDLAILLKEALKNEVFYEIFTSSRHSIQPTNKHTQGITWTSTLANAVSSLNFQGGEILGGKTGFTSEAGLCLASIAQKKGVLYLLVTTGAKGNHQTEPYHILDAFKLYEKL